MPRLLPFVLLLPVLAAPALGQRAEPPGDTAVIELPGVEVVSSILTAGPSIGSGVPARTSLVTATELSAREPRLLGDALAALPGFSLYDDLGSPFKTTLVMRGFTASPVVGLPQGISVFVDGVPVNEPDAGQVNFDLVPLAHVQQVEVLSGTASLLGPHSLGGAINLVTRRGEGPLSGEVEVEAGSHGAFAAEGSAGGSAGGWSYYAGGVHGQESGWRQLTSATLSNVLLNVGRLEAERGLRLQAFATRSRAQTAGSLPLSVYSVRPDSNLSAGDFEDLSQLHVALSGYAALGAGRGSFRAYLRGHDAERFNVNQVQDPDVRSFSENRTLGASGDWRWVRSTAGTALAVRMGAAGSVNRVSIRIFAERLDPGLTTHVESPIAELGAYSVVDLARGPLVLTGGVRQDAVRVPFRNRLDPRRDTTSVFLRLSPRGGIRLALGAGASVYSSVGRSFRAPAVIELACADPENPCPLPFALGDDPPLDPVVATTYEAGAQWTRGPAALRASAFRTGVRDDIFLFPYEAEDEPEGSTIDGYFANIDRTRREGIELDARLDSPAGHSAYLSYAFTRSTFRVGEIELFSIREEAGGENDVEPGDRLPLVPAHTASAGAQVAIRGGASLALSADYVGERWLRGDEANEEEPLEGYLRAGLRLGYRSRGWEVRGIVENLFDARYASFGTFNLNQGAGRTLERFLTPGPPRAFRLVVRRELAR